MNKIFSHKSLLLLSVLLMCSGCALLQAQVSGLSYTLSPSGEYVRWHTELGLKNAPLLGGQVGFGFGEFIELRALYLWNNKIETDWKNVAGLAAFQKNELGTQVLSYQKVGGDLRFNLLRGKVFPFVNLGAGVQTFRPSGDNDRSVIYLNAGGGLTVSSIDRLTFSLYARNTALRVNPITTFVDAQTLNELGIDATATERRSFTNWSAGASFALYLGGRKSGQLTKVDREMMRQFSGGFSGLSVPAHAFLGKLDFSDKLPFRSTRLAGANAGLNFGPLIGLRGFYWQSMKEAEWKKDDLRLYGGELNFRLNEGQGITPYLAMGGGLIDVGQNYVGKNAQTTDDAPFVMGGGGITIPLGRFVELNGGARVLLASNQALDRLDKPDQLQTNWMYHAGINLIIGRKPNKPNVVREDQAESDRLLAEQAWQAEKNALRASYGEKMSSLETAIVRAEARGDSLAALHLQKALQETRAMHDAVPVTPIKPVDLLHRAPAPVSVESQPPRKSEQKVDIRESADARVITLPVLEEGEVYIRFGKSPATMRSITDGKTLPADPELLAKLHKLERKVDSLQTLLAKRDTLQQRIIISQAPVILRMGGPQVTSTDAAPPVSVKGVGMSRELATESRIDADTVETVLPVLPKRNIQFLEGRVLAGLGLGTHQNGLQLGTQAWFGLTGTSLKIVPELVYNTSHRSGIGGSLNVVIGLPSYKARAVAPFLGVGYGVRFIENTNDTGRESFGGLNLMLGGDFKFRKADVFIEVSTLRLFDYARIALGYRFDF
ncbi:MAG TPA: hypothetical protein PLL64_00120 [Rhodothermales bacterium]|nr:hypothetical protein [Rhodothermales bacterium]